MKIIENENYVCIAKITAKTDKIEELLKIFQQLKKLSPKEDGCIRYELHQDQENHNVFTFIDRFTNKDAFDFHCNQSYTINYFDNVIPNLVESLEITTHKEIDIQ